MNKIMIPVTKPYLPLRKSFDKYVDLIYTSGWLTNFGPLEQQLMERLKEFLKVDNLLLTSNGTLALQALYKAFDLSGEVITTPFSFVATTSSLVWEKLLPQFADIDKDSFNIDPTLISQLIKPQTSAILPVHVFGRSCDVWSIENIAQKHNLKVIYDAAHAFNIYTTENKNILNYGDASILSFHATKLFHTIEGGAIVTRDAELIKECRKLINFGITGYDQINGMGTNCKMNEFSAAMGLAVLDNIDYILSERQRVHDTYNRCLNPELLPAKIDCATNNYSYYPILLKNEATLLHIRNNLLKHDIIPRRYFYPSLNTLNYLKTQQICPISENISSRILCLPIYDNLNTVQIHLICDLVNNNSENKTCHI